MTDEVRTTDPDTGAQKGVKLERPDLIPVGPEIELGRHYGMGASKYADRNWERGYAWSKSYGAARRHLQQFWAGEDHDPDPFYDQWPEELRPKHVIAAAWHCFAMAQFMDTHPEKDDRPTLYLPDGSVRRVGTAMNEAMSQDEEDAEAFRKAWNAGHTAAQYGVLEAFAQWAITREHDPEVKTPAQLVDLYYEETS